MTNHENPDEHGDHGQASDPPKQWAPGPAATQAKFFFRKIPVVEIFAGQVEGVLPRFIAPAAALVGTAMGTGFSTGRDRLAANGTIARWLERHGAEATGIRCQGTWTR